MHDLLKPRQGDDRRVNVAQDMVVCLFHSAKFIWQSLFISDRILTAVLLEPIYLCLSGIAGGKTCQV